MNADEIRESAIRRALEEVQYNERVHTGPWSDELDACPDCYRITVTVVDALGDLLPTRTERRELEDGWTGQNVDIHGNVTSVGKPCTRQRRYVTDWYAIEEGAA